ncbi:TorF family putative porin [Pseudoalteromonas tetraodonis]|uniref:TorF family putative porin n=1 Tax=Pseudoalteromonas tetraodonis TaxID=43659 RepID=UPI001BDEA618|nr:TorF family putative porin [Pseudoalteromonas tetraodonis]MBT2151842.1 TorF family putative porin [Pseudoalteromonas tetraodonis]
MLKLQKTILISALALTGMTSTTAFAEVTANAAATSNYLWRGQEQTGGDAAVSGGIDYANESGFYAGTWASNASWADEMTYELDLYAGFGGAINESVSYDVGYIYYAYPDAASGADADFSEVYGSISVQGFTFGAAVLATSAASGDGTDFGDSLYLNADYSFAVGSNGTEMALHIGHYSGDFIGDENIIDYGVSVSKDGFTFGLSDNDMDGSDVKAYVAYAVDFNL